MNFFDLEKQERKRQKETINLIASENYVSQNVLKALGSIFTNKYSEGKSHFRYYTGNKITDILEDEVKNQALKTFKLSKIKWDANVQPYSGSIANLAVLFALVPSKEKILSMDLAMGGHLTHGSLVSITGNFWKQIPYSVSKKTERINYEKILKQAKKEKPKIIIAGGSAYSRIIDFKKFRKIADAVNAILFVDMSHFAGLVAGNVYPSPFLYADVVSTTTHKTLRGPRSAIIFSKKEFISKINKAVFPGIQGGPHMNQIAAVGIALEEAQNPIFKKYAKQIIKNAKILSSELEKRKWKIISGGTDSHLFLMNTMEKGINGKIASELLEKNGIIVNKNLLPYDKQNAINPSGIRLGTPAITTRGMKEREMKIIADFITRILLKNENLSKKVKIFAEKFKDIY